MKISQQTECLLIDLMIGNDSNLPYFENYQAHKKSLGYDLAQSSLYDYILFIDYQLKSFHKQRGLESFQEYLDYKFPPQ